MKKQNFKKIPQFITLKEINENDPQAIAVQLKQYLKDGGNPALFIQAVFVLRTREMWENNYFLAPADYQSELEEIYTTTDWTHYHLKMLNDMRFFIDKIKFIFFKKTYDALNRQAGLNKLFSGIGAAVIVADYAKEHMEAKITASMVNLEHLPELLTDSDQRAWLVD